MINPYSIYKKLYPKDIQLETLVVLFHILRKTLLNTKSSMEETVSGNSGTMLLMLCVLLNVCMIFKNRKYIKASLKRTKFYTMFCLVSLASVMWTTAPGISGIIAKGTEMMSSYVLMAIILYKLKGVRQCLIYTVMVASAAAFLGALYTGFTHTNTYSISALVGAVISFGLFRYYKMNSMLFYGLFNLAILIVGTSSASYISFIIALAVLYSASKRGLNLPLLAIIVVAMFLFYKFGLDLVADYIFYGHSSQQITSGSGRDYIWDIVIESWKAKPWIGYGYVIGERYIFSQLETAFVLSAHNGYLSVLLGSGLFGMFFFAMFVFTTLWKGYKLSTHSFYKGYAAIVLAALLGVLANNMSYPVIGSDWNHPFPCVICLFILLNTLKYKLDDVWADKLMKK